MNLGPGPRRWRRAKAAYDVAMRQRDGEIRQALRLGRASARELATAYGLTAQRVYKIVGRR